jgi:DNA-binding IclR family transcriptional regulator
VNTIDAPVRDQNTIHGESSASSAVDQSTLLSVDKALSIVEILMRRTEPLSARAIADAAGINRTTTHRLLNALIHRGWIEKPAGTASYRLGLKFVALAHVGSLSRSFFDEVRPAMERLSRLTRETVHLGVLDGWDVLHVDKIDSLEHVGIASKIGSRGIPHSTGLGKALLAAGPDRVIDEYVAYATGPEPRSRLVDVAKFREEIARTRERGYSIDDEDDSIGVRCLGVAVLGAGNAPLFAMSLTGPSPRFTLERVATYAPEAMATARALSLQLGWEPGTELDSGNDV